MPRTPEFGSDVVADLLADLGVEYLACNPGATFRGLHDSVVNHATADIELIECHHEEISVAIAHGYAKASGAMMAAAVHDVVGLQHAAMAIYNAWCDQAPVLVLGATGPMDSTQRRPWIDWIHTALVQGTQVRDYTKWDDQPASLAAVPESLVRAAHVATTAPQGPVYVCLDRDVQECEVPAAFPRTDVSLYAAPSPAAPDPAAVEQTARWLVGAQRPAVVADLVGRSPAAFALLVELAEEFALPVVDRERSYNKASLNFPTLHPLNLSGDPAAALDGADAVLALEVRDLSGTLGWSGVPAFGARGRVDGPAADAAVVHATTASSITKAWAADAQRLHRAALQIPSEPEPFLRALLPRVRAHAAGDDGLPDRVRRRRTRLEARSAEVRSAWRAEADAAGSSLPIARSFLAATLDEVTRGHERVLANGSLDNWVHRLWDLDHPAQYLGDSGGAGLGYGLPAACGAALAHRGSDRLVIDVQSDGDALFTPGALWTAAHHRLPILVVMDDNRGYDNSVVHAERVARARGRPVARRVIGADLADPPVDFATLARSYGVHGEGPVTDPDRLRPALERALAVVAEQRRPALVDVVTGLTPAAGER